MEKLVEPYILQGQATSPELLIGGTPTAIAMQGLDISNETIGRTTIYADPTNRLATNGITYPRALGRLRHIFHPELRRAPGPIVCISTRVRGHERTADEMNHTLVHELEHVAQMDRNDPRLMIGNAAIWGSMALGALIGSKFGTSKKMNVAGALLGAAVGQRIGYQIAPHERQARAKAASFTTRAITRAGADNTRKA